MKWSSLTTVEINEDQLNEKAKAIYSELDIVRRSGTITCFWAETQRQGEEWGRFIVTEREGFRSVLFGGCWHRETVGKLTKSWPSYVIRGTLHPWGPNLDLNWLVLNFK